jgi:hypothetical protein
VLFLGFGFLPPPPPQKKKKKKKKREREEKKKKRGVKLLFIECVLICLICGHNERPNSYFRSLVRPFPGSSTIWVFNWVSMDMKHVSYQRPQGFSSLIFIKPSTLLMFLYFRSVYAFCNCASAIVFCMSWLSEIILTCCKLSHYIAHKTSNYFQIPKILCIVEVLGF